MNGMVYEWQWAHNPNDDWYSATWHYELAPTPTIIQVSLGSYDEDDDQGLADTAVTHIEFIDDNGVPQSQDLPISVNYDANQAISVNRLTRVDWEAIVSNSFARVLTNLFFWDSVS